MRTGTAAHGVGMRSIVGGLVIGALVVLSGTAKAQTVGSSGTPSAGYAFKLPPGIGKMVPSLGVAYTAGRSGTGVAYGWTLTGYSTITRCVPMREIDGDDGLVRYDGNDKLCLDGRRLIQTDAAGAELPFPQSADATGLTGGAYREYRLENDATTRIRAYQSAFEDSRFGPKYFQIWTADGRMRTYGQAPSIPANANATAAGNGPTAQSYVWSWGLAREEDRSGNTIDYKYEGRLVMQPPSVYANAYEWVLKTIEYGTNLTTGTSGKVTVTLNYTDDEHAFTAYVGGNRRGHKRYLTSVESAVAGASTIRVARLTYENRSFTQRSILKSIKECVRPAEGGAEKCLPSQQFTYTTNNSVNYVEDQNWTKDAAGNSNGLATSVLMMNKGSYAGILQGDFNGDGRPDLLVWGSNRLYLSEGLGNYRAIPQGTGAGKFNLVGIALNQSDTGRIEYCRISHVADVDGDGLDDVVMIAPKAPNILGCGTYTPGQSRIFRSNGDGSFTVLTPTNAATGTALAFSRQNGTITKGMYDTNPYVTSYGNFVLADFNQDGRLDILSIDMGYAEIIPGSPSNSGGAYCDLVREPNQVCDVTLWLGNGDGTFVAKKSLPFNGGSRAWAPYLRYGPGHVHRATDTDGDGVPDVFVQSFMTYQNGGMFYPNLGGGYFIGKSSGDFLGKNRADPDQSAYYSMVYGDFNGDGIEDRLWASPSQSAYQSFGTGVDSGYQGFDLSNIVYPGWAADLNGDGRTDIISVEWAWPYRIAIATAGGSIYENGSNNQYANSNLKNIRLYDVTGEYTNLESARVRSLLGNFSGSGLLEFLVMNVNPTTTPNKLYVRESLTPIDLLESVTNEHGVKTTFAYEPITRTTRYASDRGTAFAGTYPLADKGARPVTQFGPSGWSALRLRDTTPSMFVVTSVTTDSGVGTQTVKTQLAYRGFKSDQLGRGSMGFREVRREVEAPDGVSKLTSSEQRLQRYPYTGSPSVSETYLGALSPIGSTQAGQLLSRTESIYCDQTSTAGAENTATVSAPCPSTSKIKRPYVRKSTQTGADLSGTALPTTTTTTTYTGGYPTLIQVDTAGTGPAGAQTFVKKQAFEYWPDNIAGDNWLLGLVKKSTVTNTVPDSLNAITTSAGSAPKATATSGQ